MNFYEKERNKKGIHMIQIWRTLWNHLNVSRFLESGPIVLSLLRTRFYGFLFQQVLVSQGAGLFRTF